MFAAASADSLVDAAALAQADAAVGVHVHPGVGAMAVGVGFCRFLLHTSPLTTHSRP